MRWAGLLMFVALVNTAPGQDASVIAKVDWQAGEHPEHEVVDDPQHGRILVVSAIAGQERIPVAEITDLPGLGAVYHVAGQVRYEGVTDPGYLEMWSHLPNGKTFFSRTLSQSGPMAELSGNSGWRPFLLPADSRDPKAPEQRVHQLEINVVLPGNGKVWLSGLEVRAGLGLVTPHAGAWWSERTGGLIGGILGSTIGVLGALAGTLASFHRWRNVAIRLLGAMAMIGGGLTVMGLLVVAAGQPYGVFYPLLMTGLISLLVGGGVRWQLLRQARDAELLRIRAMDAGG